MDNFVITIARQYGSGGRTVGEMLAKKLGIGYYEDVYKRQALDRTYQRCCKNERIILQQNDARP